MTRNETFRGSRRPSRGGRRAAGPGKVRLLVELLEQRLPPGDAVFAGLLARELIPVAQRATESVSVVPPGPAQRLAPPAPFDLAADLKLVADVPPPPNRGAVAPGESPVAPALGDLGALTQPRSSASSLALPPASPVASAPGTLSTQYSVLGTPYSFLGALTQPRSLAASANYQLDQAVAALALPAETLPEDEGTQGARIRALFNLGHPTTGPFPSNWFTVEDQSHNTGRRVNLPLPDCKVYVSDCEDLAVLNELDGFNLQPWLSIPFSGPIDVNSVNYTNVFLVSLGSTTDDDRLMPRGYGVGINQVVWDVATNTLHVESDELLAQHTRFALYVTRGVRDAQGDPVRASPAFLRFLHRGQGNYHDWMLDAMLMAKAYGFEERDIVTASVFTTQSATAVLEKIRDQIKAETPEPANFLLGPKGERTVFPFTDETSMVWRQQTQVEPPVFNPVNFSLSFLRDIFPGAVGKLAFGKYVSPDYQVHLGEYIPPVGTRTGTPVVQGTNEIYFNLVLPSGPAPEGGWPVAIFGHGNLLNKNADMPPVAASQAARGVATLLINAVGHGFGPLGTLTVNQTVGEPVTFSAGGRGIDQNRNNLIAINEGIATAPPRDVAFFSDGIRQTAADLMQLVRVIEVGMDVDGDGQRDLDASRISYFGHSLGANYGTVFLAVEPNVRTGVLAAPGNPPANRQLGPGGRGALGNLLNGREPSLLNSPGVTVFGGLAVGAPRFHENLPLRDGIPLTVELADGTMQVIQSPVTNTVAGARAIQQVIENIEWVSQAGSPVAYAPHLRRAPLPGVPAKSVIVQFAKGDESAPNPNATAILRAGDLADRTLYYRHDLARAERPSLLRDPHGFARRMDLLDWRDIVLGAQSQSAVFFASDGTKVIHPEPARFFEVPIQGPLPEELNFLP